MVRDKWLDVTSDEDRARNAQIQRRGRAYRHRRVYYGLVARQPGIQSITEEWITGLPAYAKVAKC